jgi:hypothetical protein
MKRRLTERCWWVPAVTGVLIVMVAAVLFCLLVALVMTITGTERWP